MEKNIAVKRLEKFGANFFLMLGLFAVCLIIILLVGDMIFEDNNLNFDHKVFAAIAPHVTEGRTNFIRFITFFGSAQFLLPFNIAILLIFLINKNIRYHFWKVAVVYIFGTGVLFGLKELLKRQRPLVPLISKAHGYSFPSGHTFSAIVFYGMIIYFVSQTKWPLWVKVTLQVLLFIFVLLIGFSRIYLKVHYATDVIAGLCFGLMWMLLCYYFLVYRRKFLPADNEKLIVG